MRKDQPTIFQPAVFSSISYSANSNLFSQFEALLPQTLYCVGSNTTVFEDYQFAFDYTIS